MLRGGLSRARRASEEITLPWLTKRQLRAAHSAAESAFDQLRADYDARLSSGSASSLPLPPWEYHRVGRSKQRFRFREGYSYTGGRLSMPLLSDKPPFNRPLFESASHLKWLCDHYYHNESCTRTTQGALWNFPGANSTFWHRDYPNDWKLLTVVTAARDYPLDAGWLKIQRGTQLGGRHHLETLQKGPPQPGQPEPEQIVLEQGDSLVFTATSKHAATPNPSPVSRCLLFAVYTVGGRQDSVNQPSTVPWLSANGPAPSAHPTCRGQHG